MDQTGKPEIETVKKSAQVAHPPVRFVGLLLALLGAPPIYAQQLTVTPSALTFAVQQGARRRLPRP